METKLEDKDVPIRKNLTLNALLKTIDKYDLIRCNDHETRKRAKQLILEASKRIIERNQGAHKKALTRREGSRTRLRGIASYANKLSNLLEPVLLHIDEINYAKSILEDFMPRVEEAARYATKLDPETAAQMLRVLNSAETIDLTFNQGLREVFEEVIQLHITPTKQDSSRLLLDLAQSRFQAGEYLTSYLLSREATRSILEDLTGAFPKDLGPDDAPSSDWRFEDYLGYLMEAGLVPTEHGKKLLELFVGEPEHLNSRWKKRREAEKALNEIRSYLEIMDANDDSNNDWL